MHLLRVSLTSSRALLGLLSLLAVTAVAAVTAVSAHADTTIINPANDTVLPWGGVNQSLYPTFGQTVTAPTGDSVLTSFTFSFADGPGGQTYRAYVFAWNGTTLTGSALFTSGVLTAPTGIVPVTINTGNLALTAGNQYALFFSTLQLPSVDGPYYRYLYNTSSSSYTGGGFIGNREGATNTTTTIEDLHAETWSTVVGDMAFTATFAPAATAAAPEPGSIALLLTAGVPVVGLVRRRKTAR